MSAKLTIKLADIQPNPNNPRFIRDDKFEKLKASIEQFPKMMALRPIVVDESGTVLGGNMRLRALQELGYKEVPPEWVRRAGELTEDEKRRFIITDNAGFGQWDWETPVSGSGIGMSWLMSGTRRIWRSGGWMCRKSGGKRNPGQRMTGTACRKRYKPASCRVT